MVVLTGMAISTSLVGCCVVQRASADTNDPRWRAHPASGQDSQLSNQWHQAVAIWPANKSEAHREF